jgi:hypothetical protein
MTVGKTTRSRGTQSAFTKVVIVMLILLAVAFTFTQRHTAAAAQNNASATQVIQNLILVGTSTIQSTPLGSGAVQEPEIAVDSFGDSSIKGAAVAQASASPTLTHRHGLAIPSKEEARHSLEANTDVLENSAFPPPEPVVSGDLVVPFQGSGFEGFNGISHVDSRTANNGNQFSVEPPDQGLCAGNGYVMEVVNIAVRVFDTEGNPLTGVQDTNSFFHFPAAIVRGTPNKIGPTLSDPRCYFDPQVRRWFVSVLMEDNGNNPGATGRNFNLLAVSQTDHPTGAFTVFMYDVTDDGLNGTSNHAGCPCFGDQPLLGTDKFGVFQTTNEYQDATLNFNGAQIYAISKPQLVAAAESPTGPLPVVVHFDASQQLVPFGGLSYSIQPATSPTGDDREGEDNESHDGVEYFLSALQFVDTFDNRIAVWAITNTSSLNTNSPSLTLSFAVIRSETYGQPNPAVQKAGEFPLGTLLGDSEERLNTNDDRMNQVVLAGGVLYGSVNSVLKVDGAEQQGIAWFGVKPSFDDDELEGHVVKQGYVAVAGADVFFPSIGVNDDGNGVIAFSLSGANYFPSAAYVDMVDGHSRHFVHIAAAGHDPEDGFSGYKQFAGATDGIGRWGDYSAAVADGEHIWFASEYIPKACPSIPSTTIPPCRTVNANWGTFVSAVRPFGSQAGPEQ